MTIDELSREIKERNDIMLSYNGGVAFTKEFDEWFKNVIKTVDFADGVSCTNYDYALMQVSNNVAQFCIFSLKEGIERISNENHIGIQDDFFKEAIKNYTVRATIGDEVQIVSKTWEEEYFLIREYYKTYGRISKEVATPMNAYNSDICSIETGEDNANGELTVTIIDGTNNEVVYEFKDVVNSPMISITRKTNKIKYIILTAITGVIGLGIAGVLTYFILK